MPRTLEGLTRRSDTLGGIRGIVRTMKTLSAINAVPYEQAAEAIESYHQTILTGFQAFLHRTDSVAMGTAPAETQVMVVFGSDHGLCGGYNELLVKHALAELKRGDPAVSTRVLCVGARAEYALLDHGIDPERVFLTPASADGIGRFAGELVTELEAMNRGHRSDSVAVTLAFTRRVGHGLQEPVVQPLLPLPAELTPAGQQPPWVSRSLPDYNMPSDALFSALIRNHIFASVFRASAEALVTENTARLALMQQAEQSVDERLGEVDADLRSVRQDDITTELLDVIIGFEALKKRRKPT